MKVITDNTVEKILVLCDSERVYIRRLIKETDKFSDVLLSRAEFDKIAEYVKEQDAIKKCNSLENDDVCIDCQRDKDLCPDCYEHNLYLSPDQLNPKDAR